MTDESLQHILGALGVGCESSSAIEQSLIALDESDWRRTLPPVLVMVDGVESQVPVHVPHGTAVRVHVVTEVGIRVDAAQVDVWVEPREIDGELVGRATFTVPSGLPTGWHTVHAEVADGTQAECTLAITPARLTTADKFTAHQRWGLAVQLYSVRSRRSWGSGICQISPTSPTSRELSTGQISFWPIRCMPRNLSHRSNGRHICRPRGAS